MSNPHEAAARNAKAQALALRLGQAGITADQASDLTEASWLVAAKNANVKPPSAETRALVVTILQTHERLANTDPFDGLPS